MSGPPPEPSKLRMLKGNPGRRPFTPNELTPPSAIPDCPAWLDAEARAEWARVIPQLDALGILTRLDRAEVAAYCACWSRWKAAYLTLRELGTTFQTASGYLMPRPEVAIEQKTLALLRVYAADFGMNPSARSRISTPAPKEDSLDALLG